MAGFNLALLLAWGWLYWPVLRYFGVLLTSEEFRVNQVALLLIAGLFIYQARRACLRPRLATPPRAYLPGVALALGGSLAYLLVERFLDINTLAAVLFGLATYGLAGLWLPERRWRQGLPAALLALGFLPFGDHLETFVGYPLRVATAGAARDFLPTLGFHSVGADTILVFESGISQVDLPCSGVKSLWTGGLFLLAATWLENRRINLGWFLIAGLTAGLLALANLVRVTVLALAGPALGWTYLASLIHVPLGALGFLAVCLVALWLVRRLPGWPVSQDALENPAGRLSAPVRQAWLSPLLALAAAGMALAYTPRPADAASASPLVWNFSPGITVAPAPLTAQQLAWVRQGGAEWADRYTFTWTDPATGVSGADPVAGTLMLLTSQTWRGQHNPERCFEAFGLSTQESGALLVAADFPLRWLTLNGESYPDGVSAVYWLQSADQTTDDFGQRMWSDLSLERRRWVLVTVLFDRLADPASAGRLSFYSALRDTVKRGLSEKTGQALGGNP